MTHDPDEADRIGRTVYEQLRACGITDEEMAHDAPTDATPEATYAWLEGRGPCPVPGIDDATAPR